MAQNQPPSTSRRERFKRVATRRTRQVLKDIERLRRCANRAGYQYSEADVEKIFSTINREIDIARAQFGKGISKEVELFSIDE